MDVGMHSAPLEALAQRFRRFALRECRDSSPLYEHLALAVATDDELLQLAAPAARHTAPNLLFAAVHDLLLKGQEDVLTHYYPDLTPTPRSPDTAYPAFRAFCLRHAATLHEVITTHFVQTNEVRRCAVLFPAFSLIASLAATQPLALIEIGASAGLNLLWDQYGYRYTTDTVYGRAQSPVQIACGVRGAHTPPFASQIPEIALRVGIDLHPMDVRHDEDVRWLRALIWPEHAERARLLQHAVEIAKRHPPTLLAGDGIALLPEVLRSIPAHTAVSVFHTYTINQFSVEERERLTALLAEHAARRDLYRVSVEWIGSLHPQLELTSWHAGHQHQRLLARCDSHGRWLEWLDTSAGTQNSITTHGDGQC
jgi:hypothetical protein